MICSSQLKRRCEFSVLCLYKFNNTKWKTDFPSLQCRLESSMPVCNYAGKSPCQPCLKRDRRRPTGSNIKQRATVNILQKRVLRIFWSLSMIEHTEQRTCIQFCFNQLKRFKNFFRVNCSFWTTFKHTKTGRRLKFWR